MEERIKTRRIAQNTTCTVMCLESFLQRLLDSFGFLKEFTEFIGQSQVNSFCTERKALGVSGVLLEQKKQKVHFGSSR